MRPPARTVLSTGSPLSVEGFEWVCREVKTDLQLASISGGTDLVSCFMLGSPVDPVYPGEIQKRGLGMKVEAWSAEGKPLVGEKGELVCTAPFPSMPVRFWNDPDGRKYREAYFGDFPGVWRHGDWIEITPRGGVIVYGRSDATLNPGGVRIGTAEIYRVMETIGEVADSLVVGHRWDGDVIVPSSCCARELFGRSMRQKKATRFAAIPLASWPESSSPAIPTPSTAKVRSPSPGSSTRRSEQDAGQPEALVFQIEERRSDEVPVIDRSREACQMRLPAA
jgi:acyl-CoA synthetase (AMP-forming)/AMP-acid ligase II